MARVYEQAYFGDKLVPLIEASLNIGTSAVLYGLSVYTVFHVQVEKGKALAFRLRDHYLRLCNSTIIIGIDAFKKEWSEERFVAAMRELVKANAPKENVFIRATVHVSAMVPGTRSRGLPITFSAFLYEAMPIVPQDGMRLKTSVWRRIPDNSIPSRAKVNGAYVNSVLAKQDAIDSGYDDCIFLDGHGHVCELSAANIFIVRDGVLITPDTTSDLLEGINRKTVLELAKGLGIEVKERSVDLSELYIADEAFACGTSAFIAPIHQIDAREIGTGTAPITDKIRKIYQAVLSGTDSRYTTNLLVGK